MARITIAELTAMIEAQNAQIVALTAKLDEVITAKPAKVAPTAKKAAREVPDFIVARAQKREAAGKPARARTAKVANVAKSRGCSESAAACIVDARRALGRMDLTGK